MPVSRHFRGCKAPLSGIVSGTISSELPLLLLFMINLDFLFAKAITKPLYAVILLITESAIFVRFSTEMAVYLGNGAK